MGWFKSKLELSEEENFVVDIIKLLLANKETIIDIDPEDMSYLLSLEDETRDFLLEVDSVGFKLTNHTFFMDRRCSVRVIEHIMSLMKEETSRRRKEKKERGFRNGIFGLDKIKQSLL